jgi:drug/metabolite transporter (DMT)-like permease
MSVPLAFIGVILIWSTTPLAIKWSIVENNFLFGVTSRMILGGILAISAVMLLRISWSFSRRAKWAYFASGLGIYSAMSFSYWGSIYIPSGWISVIFGTSPVLTGILAWLFLGEKMTVFRVCGLVFGVLGLSIIFLHSSHMTDDALLGVSLIILGVISQTSTAIWIKKLNTQQHGLVMTAGGLWVSIPLFIITYFLFAEPMPSWEEIPLYAAGSIVYLAIFGSLIGFSLYYYLIHQVEASTVSLITLITPVSALMLGMWLNNETISLTIIMGTICILLGLSSFQWGDKLFYTFKRLVVH